MSLEILKPDQGYTTKDIMYKINDIVNALNALSSDQKKIVAAIAELKMNEARNAGHRNKR